MAHIVLYIAASLDGYIARKDGAIDWLSMVEREEEDYGYGAFYDSVDAVVTGSKTYELGLGFKEWPYPGKKTFPVILGEGIPLFPPPGSEQPPELTGVKQYPSGLVQTRYARATDSSPTRRAK